jgi:hypothetical protein
VLFSDPDAAVTEQHGNAVHRYASLEQVILVESRLADSMLDVASRTARVGGTASAVGFFLATAPRPRLRAQPCGSVLAGAETWGSRSGLNIASSTSDRSMRRRVRQHLVEVALTRCYTIGQMPDDVVIFIRCDSAEEKRAFAAAASTGGLVRALIAGNRSSENPGQRHMTIPCRKAAVPGFRLARGRSGPRPDRPDPQEQKDSQ